MGHNSYVSPAYRQAGAIDENPPQSLFSKGGSHFSLS